MSSRKGKFTYKPVANPSSSYPSPRKRKRSHSPSPSHQNPPVYGGVVGDAIDEYDDEFDSLGVAALDNFEQSQNSPPVANIPRPPSSSQDASSLRVVTQNRQGYPYGGRTSLATPPSPKLPRRSAEEAASDQLCAKDGEIKILRERLIQRDERLAQRDKEYQQMTQSKATEREQLEQRHRKETEALRADLAFKNKEIADLQETCHKLEQVKDSKPQSVPLSNGSGQNILPVTTSSRRRKAEFTSTETFIPSSEIAASGSKVTHVPPNRKKRSRSTSHTHSVTAGSMSRKTNKGSQTVTGKCDLFPTNVHSEMSGAQLVRVLLQRNLLSVPNYQMLETQLMDRNDIPSNTESLMQSFGLLSLLQSPMISSTPSIATPPSSQVSSITITPINRQCAAVGMTHRTNAPPIFTSCSRSIKRPLLKPTLSSAQSVDSELSLSFVTTPQSLSLQQSLASLLKASDRHASISFSNTKMPHYSLDSTALKTLGSSSSDKGVSLLPSFESILDSYLQEQILRKQKESKDKPLSSLRGGTVTMDNYSSSSNSDNTESSSSPHTETQSSSYGSLSEESVNRSVSANQSLVLNQRMQVLQVALALETLIKYSEQVRKALWPKPPHFNESELGSVVVPSQSSSEDDSSEEEEEQRERQKRSHSREGSVPFKLMENTTLKGSQRKASPVLYSTSTIEVSGERVSDIPLSSLLGGEVMSNKVFVKKEQVQKGHLQYLFTPTDVLTCGSTLTHLYSTGNLFDVLLDLVLNLSWEEDAELLCSILESLTGIASDCSEESLERYGVLLKGECVLVSLLLLQNPDITLRVVSLLIPLARSSQMIQLFCNNSHTCLLDHFYALYVPRSTVPSVSLRTKIELQLTRFLSQLTLTEQGEEVLYNSECCSHQLLKSLASSFLNVLRDLESEELTNDLINKKHRQMLAESMVSLLHTVCNKDCHIEEHKSECYHIFIECLNKGYRKMRGTAVEELILDLLECEGISEDEEQN